ncbi:MAG: glycosyltransferase [Caldilinea sp. CFX5]|nr:glycosyltransferase [Caldilinea sp. CFX5]
MMVGHLLLLTAAAWAAPKETPVPPHKPRHRFAILVPAHNEEKLLPALLESLSQLQYPRQLFSIHVVADNCIDETAAIARAAGAIVHERFDLVNIGKGYALQWLLARLEKMQVSYDAALILDADSIVSPNFLTVMNAHLNHGERVIQAHYAVLNPERSWVMSLRAAALALVHYLRPLGRMALGGSVGLKGNGMVFQRAVLAEHQWSASVTEDIDYHMALILSGERVAFAPDATVWAEMPGTLRSAQTQNIRWEQGRLQLARYYVPLLLQAAFTPQQFGRSLSRSLLFDSIMEHIIPPFSVVMGLSVVYWFFAWLCAMAWGGTPLLILATLLLVGQLIYIVAGLVLAGTPPRTYLALLYAPIFVFWKIQLILGMLTRGEKQGWVRTARDGA